MKSIRLAKTAIAINKALFLSASLAIPAFTFAAEADVEKQAVLETAVVEKNGDMKKENVEVIEVNGIRSSLRDNLNNKRFSDAIVDSINTEDIAKNPDRNMAEALQRIPGVQISSEFGEGVQVSIRGTRPEFTNTLLNGQTTQSAQTLPLRGETNAFDFSSMSADQISKIEVFKSPQADLPAGGIGGTVVLHTKKPLQRKNNSGYLKVEGNYNDAFEKYSPQISGLYSWKNDQETFGASLNLGYQQVNTQRDGNEAIGGLYGYYRDDKESQITNSLDNTNLYSTQNDTYEKPGTFWGVPNSARFFREKERVNGTLSLEFAPKENLDFSLDYTYNYNDNDNESHAFLSRMYRMTRWAYSDGADSAPGYKVDRDADMLLHAEANLSDIALVNSRGVRYGGPIDDLIAMELQDRDGSYAVNDQFNFTTEYSVGDLFMKVQLGRSTATSKVNDFGTQFNLNFADENGDGIDDNGLDEALLYYDYDLASDTVGWGVNGNNGWIANPTTEMYLQNFFKTKQNRKNTENYAQADITWELDSDFYITSLKSGFKYRQKNANNVRSAATSKTVDGERIVAGELAGGTIDGVRSDVGTFPQSFFDVDKSKRDAIWNDGHLLVDSLDDCATAALDTSYRGCRTDYKETQTEYYDQDSDVFEAYVMANFAGENWRGNVGVRLVDTKRESLTYQNAGVDANNQNIYEQIITQSDTQDILPSFNLSYNLTDSIVLRTAASLNIDHPSLEQVRDGFSVNGNYDKEGELLPEGSQRTGSRGNPDLGSYQVKQYEFGLEWYFTESSLFGITAFRKDLTDLIRSQTGIQDLTGEGLFGADGQVLEGDFAISSNYNVGKQDISGYEVQLQHDFGNGFGLLVNYTYTDVPSEFFTSQDFEPVSIEVEGEDERLQYSQVRNLGR